jgi:2-dehydro-3-deoxy-D-arabinonate dehydratase
MRACTRARSQISMTSSTRPSDRSCFSRTRPGDGRSVPGSRSRSGPTVAEPELAVVLGDGGEPIAVTIGNDVSARDIEGANPLYLPQAKVYAGACALGPALRVPVDWTAPFNIELRILSADENPVFAGHTSTDSMHRTIPTLIEFLRRDNPVPAGSVLLTGTGIVPPDDITLQPGQSVEISIAGIGKLRNPLPTSD